MAFAEASVVKIGTRIDKLRIANATEANPAIIHFIESPSLNVQCFKNTSVGSLGVIIKFGHCEIQLRPRAVKTGQLPHTAWERSVK